VTTDCCPTPAEDGDVGAAVLTLIPGSAVVDDATVQLARRLVDASDVVDRLTELRDAARRGPGGRPETFPTYALLVSMALCVITDQHPHIKRFCDVMFRQLTPNWRAALGIPDPPAVNDTRGWRGAYRNVRSRFHAMVELMDPSPTPKNRRLDDATFKEATEHRRSKCSEEQWAARYGNLEWFVNQLLEASIRLIPTKHRAAWMGSVGVDATLVRSFSRGESRTNKTKSLKKSKQADHAVERHASDPDAGWYRRTPNSDDAGQKQAGESRSIFGYEASLVVSGPDTFDAELAFPNIVVGMAVLHKPGHEPGANGVRALASVRGRGYPAGYVGADRAYSNAVPENFQLPVLALGYKPVYDYKIDQLGVKGSYQGFIQIEGALYCPMIPQALIDATVDYREGRIDEALYGQRLQERWRYRARAKGQPDAEGHIRYQCPSASQWQMARCDLKPDSLNMKTQGRLRVIPTAELKASPSACCTQQSVTVPPDVGAKFRQELLYGSAEWKTTYSMLRNTTEGVNGYVKDPAHEALDEPGRRRIHGVAAQSVLTALLLMAANVRKIRSFLAAKASTKPGTARPRRRRTRSIATWRPAPLAAAPSSGPDPPLTA